MAAANSWRSPRVDLFDLARWARAAANPATSVVVLIFATALYGFRLDVASLGIRPEHIALIVVGVFWARQALSGRWRLTLKWQDLLLLLYLAVALIASALNAPIPRESFQYLALMILCVAVYLLVRGLVNDAATFRAGLLALVVVGALEGLEGIVTWLLYPLGLDLRMQLYPLGRGNQIQFCTFSPAGTQVESNIYGSYVMAGALLAMPILLAAATRSRRRWVSAALLLMLVAVALSLTRTVWVALLVGVVFVFWLAETPRRRILAATAPFLAFAVIVALFASNFQLPCHIVVHAGQPTTVAPGPAPNKGETGIKPATGETGTKPAPGGAGTQLTAGGTDTTPPAPSIQSVTIARIFQGFTLPERLGTYGGAISNWLNHPWLGNGPNSYGQTHESSAHTPAWISSAPLMSLHDTGIVGTLILAAWLAWLAFRLAVTLRRAPPGFTRTGLLALGIAGVGLAVAYQLTTALWLGFTWVLLGLISAGTTILSREGESAPSATFPARGTGLEIPLTLGHIITSAAARLRANWLVLVLLGVGAATAFYRLGAKGLWGDEVWQTWWATDRTLFLAVRAPTDMPLQFVLVRMATLFSNSEFWVRLPSALLAAANVALVFLLGRREFGTRTGVVAALLVAAAPYHVWFAQDARPYAPLSLYSILTLYFFLDLMRHPGRRVWLAFTIATALNIWNHFFGLMAFGVEFVIAVAWMALGHLITVRAQPERDARGSKLFYPPVAVGISGLLASLAMLPLLIGPTAATSLQNFVYGAVRPQFQLTPAVVAATFAAFGAGYGWPLVLMFALFVVGVAAALYLRKWFVLIGFAWLVLPLAVLGIVQPRYQLAPKYLLFMQPVYLLLVGFGLLQVCAATGKFARRVLAFASARKQSQAATLVSGFIIGAVMLVMFTPTASSYWIEKVNDWSAICAYLHGHVKAGDAVTGETYTEGAINWCLGNSSGGAALLPLRNYSMADLAASGWNIWYIRVVPDSPNLASLKEDYQAIPKSAWGKTGLLPSDYGSFPFSQGEHPATIYYHAAGSVPREISFHQIRGSGSAPDYAQIAPGAPLVVRLSLPAAAPRTIQVSFWDLPGTALVARANDILLPKVKPDEKGQPWVTGTIALPRNVPDTFLLELQNQGNRSAAVSAVKVEYQDPNQ
jgi:uncharacterized membrane protein